jgi:tetratricopeptide (TPR) repeat protein
MKYLSIPFVLLVCFSGFAQKGNKGVTPPAVAKTDTAAMIAYYESMYAEALKFNDFQVATNAMYAILAYHPSDIGIKDTLARLYFTRGMSVQAVLVGMEVVEAQPNNLAVLEVVAASQENLGLNKEALETYEKLLTQTKTNYYRYQVASLQYKLARLGECKTNLEALLNLEGVDTDKITMTYGQAGSQEVSIKAAATNMLGVLALDLKQPDTAKQLFEAAIKLEPDFVLPKANLEQMAKAAASASNGGASGN